MSEKLELLEDLINSNFLDDFIDGEFLKDKEYRAFRQRVVDYTEALAKFFTNLISSFKESLPQLSLTKKKSKARYS